MEALAVPPEPKDDLDALIEYLRDRFPQRKRQVTEMFAEGKRIADPTLVVRLAYEALLFRFELDEWLPFAKQLLDEKHGEQLQIAHTERTTEAQERTGSKRASADVVKGQAQQLVAPLQRAYDELRLTHDSLGKVLTWCQSQAKLLRSEEYEAMTQAAVGGAKEIEGSDTQVVRPPTSAKSLERMRRARA